MIDRRHFMQSGLAAGVALGGTADIALLGPEVPIYGHNGDSPTQARIFCGMTAAAGYLLCAREKNPSFDRAALRGADVMGWRPASTPQVFPETAMRLQGLDPRADLRLVDTIAPPSCAAAWRDGRTQFAIFSEPEAAQLELDGQAHVVASIGATVDQVDDTVFAATDGCLQTTAATVQAWTQAMMWTESASTPELAKVFAPFFPAASAQAPAGGIERYRALKLWKTTPAIAPSAIDRFQDILVDNRLLPADRRVQYESIVAAHFAERVR